MLSRLAGALLIAAMLVGCKAPTNTANMDLSMMPRDAAERNRLVTLLAQGVNGPSNPADTAVALWQDPIRIAILGRGEATRRALYDQEIQPFMADFQAITAVPFELVSADDANVLVVMADDVGALRRDFEPPMDRVLRDPQYTAVFERLVELQQESCAYVALDQAYAYFGAVIFSRLKETDPHFADCLGPALATMVGLQGKLSEPGSIKSKGAYLPRLTDFDRKALRILYSGKPGQLLRDIPALQDAI